LKNEPVLTTLQSSSLGLSITFSASINKQSDLIGLFPAVHCNLESLRVSHCPDIVVVIFVFVWFVFFDRYFFAITAWLLTFINTFQVTALAKVTLQSAIVTIPIVIVCVSALVAVLGVVTKVLALGTIMITVVGIVLFAARAIFIQSALLATLIAVTISVMLLAAFHTIFIVAACHTTLSKIPVFVIVIVFIAGIVLTTLF
jgi:hypothetical protein